MLFRHEGKVTHHIGSVAGKFMIARSSQTKAEIRHKDTGHKQVSLNIQGLNCSLEDTNGRFYVGSQFKKLLCVSSNNFELLATMPTQGSVNSLSLGFSPNILICG